MNSSNAASEFICFSNPRAASWPTCSAVFLFSPTTSNPITAFLNSAVNKTPDPGHIEGTYLLHVFKLKFSRDFCAVCDCLSATCLFLRKSEAHEKHEIDFKSPDS